MAMQLTASQRAMLEGAEGEIKGKVMKTLVLYGETFGAEKMVPITSEHGHLVTSFGLSVLGPVYTLMDQLIEGNALSQQTFSVDPRPLDKKVPANLMQSAFFKVMYSKQGDYEKQLKKLGLMGEDAFTCTCYMEELGNIPKQGEILSWAESSAVVYANSVLGARCNRNSGILELFGSIAGCVPYFGLLTDEGRKAAWKVEVKTSKCPEAQILGSAIGMKVMEEVPYIQGLDQWLGTRLDERAKAYLKDMGAATASNGAVGLYHVENLTPEAKEKGTGLLADAPRTYVIDDEELNRVKESYPCVWKNPHAAPRLAFVGCPHLSLEQLRSWTDRVAQALSRNGCRKVGIPTVFTTSPGVKKKFDGTVEAGILSDAGVVVSSICPLMYMNNPMCAKMPVITSSNKLRTYSTARYYTDEEILTAITKGGC